MTLILQLFILIITISGAMTSTSGTITKYNICFEDQIFYDNTCYDLDNLLISNNKTYYLTDDLNDFDFQKLEYEKIYKFKFEMISNKVVSDNLNLLPITNIMLEIDNNQYIIKPILQ